MFAALRGPWLGAMSVSLRAYVTAAMLVVLLPLLGHAVLVTWYSYSASRHWAEQDLLGDAEHLAEDVDARLDVARSVMHIVSQSPAARRGDVASVREHLVSAQAAGLIRAAVVTDPEGRVLAGAGLRPGAEAAIAGASEHLLAARLEGEPVLAASLPIRSADPRLARLEFAVSVAVLRSIRGGDNTWPWHVTVVTDRNGEMVWSAQAKVGSEVLRQIHDPSATAGVLHDWIAPNGEVHTIGYARAQRSGLTVVVAQPVPGLYQRVPFGPLGAVAIAVGATVLSVALARLGTLHIIHAYQAALRGTRAPGLRIDEATRLGAELRSSRDRLFQAVGGIAVVELTRAPGRRWGEAEVEASANIRAMLELGPDEALTADRLLRHLAPEDRAGLTATLAGAAGQASVFTRLVRTLRPGKPVRYFNVVGMLREAVPGAPAQLLLTLQDVTAQKETELLLRAQASRLRLATEIAGLGVWERDPGRNIGEGSDRLWEIMGRTPGGPLDMNLFLEMVHPDDRERVAQTIRVRTPSEDVPEGGKPTQIRYRIVRPDGIVRHVRSSRVFVDDPEGAGTRVVGVLIDETEAVMAQRALAASEARFRLAVDVAELGVFERYTDPHRNVGVWNERMWRIRGLEPRAEPMGYDELVAMIHPDDRERIVAAMRDRRNRDDGSTSYEFRIVRPDGEERIIQSRSVRTYHPEDEAVSIVAINLDVTERRRAEQALREGAAQLELAVETAQLGFAQVDPATGQGMWNERLYAIYGLPARTGRPGLEEVLERVHPEDRAAMLADLGRQRAAPDGQPVESAFRIVRPDGQERIVQVRSVRRVRADGSATVSTVTQDVTELRRAEQALRESAAQLELAVETARLGFALRDAATGRGTWSDWVFRIYGLAPSAEPPTPEQMLAQVHPQDRAAVRDAMARQRTAGEGEVQESEYRILRPDGQERFVHARGQRLRRPDGSEILSTVVQDVTERRRAERALEEAAARLHLAVETAELGVAQLDPATGQGTWSDRLFRIYGLEPRAERPSVEEWMPCVHPDDRERVRATMAAQRAKPDGDVAETEFRILRPDGQQRMLHVRSVQLRRADGSETLSTVTRDVTEQRRAEMVLAASEARLRLAVETAKLGVAELDIATGKGVWNEQQFRICGLDPAAGRPSLDEVLALVHPEDRAMFAREVAGLRQAPDGHTLQLEVRITRRDGAERVLHVHSTTVRRPGSAGMLLTVTQDITERRQAERALADSEARLRLAVETAGLGVAERNLATGDSTWNAQMCRIVGVDESRPVFGLAEATAMIHPDDRAHILEVRAQHADAADGFASEYDFRMVRTDGQVRILHSRSVTLRGVDGSARLLSVNQDVTEQRCAEQALADSELRLRLAVDAAGLGIWDYDKRADRTVWSDRMWRIRGLEPSADGPTREQTLAAVVEEDRPALLRFWEWIGSGETDITYEYRVRRPDGAVRHVSGLGRVVRDATGEVVRVVGVSSDITERRLAELQVAESELRLRLATDVTGVGIWDHDPATGTTVWNDQMFRLRGLQGQGHAPDLAFIAEHTVEQDRALLLEAWDSLKHGQPSLSFEYRVRWPDGSVRWLHSEGRSLYDAQGRVVRMLGVVMDVTAQREAELALLDRNTTLELAIEAADLGIWTRDVGTTTRQASARLWSMLGHPGREGPMTLEELLACLHPDDREPMLRDWVPDDGNPAVRLREFRAIWPDGTVRLFQGRRAVMRDAAGKTLRVIGLVADVTEARRAAAALETSETRLRLAVEAAELGIFDYDPDMREGYWSERTWRMRGLEPRESIPSLDEVKATLHPEDREAAIAKAQQAFAAPDGTLLDNEFRVVWPDGTVRHLLLRAVVRRGEDGRARVFGVNMDITERRAAALALEASEARLRLAVETAELGFFEHDPASRTSYWSDRIWRMRGLEPQERAPAHEEAMALVHPEDRARLQAHIAGLATLPHGGVAAIEYRVVRADGATRHLVARTMTLRAADGTGMRFHGINLDVTEIRRAAEALEASEARLRLAVETAGLGFFDDDPATRAGQWSERMWRMRGLEPRETKPSFEEALALVHPDDRERVVARIQEQQSLPHGSVGDLEFRVVWPDGSVHHIQSRAITQRGPDGGALRLFGINLDVTDIRTAALALEESEARLRLASEAAGLGVFQFTMPSGTGYWSDRMWRMHGLEPRPGIPTPQEALAAVHPDDLPLVRGWRAAAGNRPHGDVARTQFRLVMPGGAIRHVAMQTLVLHGRRKEDWTLIGVSADITEQVEREQALRETAARYELAVDAAEMGVFEFDPETRTGYWSDRIWLMRGLEPRPGTLSFQEVIDLVHPADRDSVSARMREQFAGPDGMRGEYEFRIVRPDGTVRYIQSRAVTQRRPDGGLHRLFGVNLDITERRLAAQALEESEARLRLASEAAGLGVFQANMPDGTGYWSDQMWRIRGLEPQPGLPGSELAVATVHPDDRNLVRGLRRAAAGWAEGEVVRQQFRVIWPDGALRHVASFAIALRGREEGAFSLIGVNIDITEQVEREQALRDSAARLELAIDAAGLAVWDWEAATDRWIWSTRAWERAGNSQRLAMLAPEDRLRAVHPDDRDKVPSAWIRSVRAGEDRPGDGEYRVIRPDGALLHLSWRGIPLRDGEGRIVRFAGVVADVTEARRAELALRTSEELFRMAAEAAEQGVWNHDLATGSITWSARLWRMHGLPPQEGAPAQEARIALIHPEDRAEVLGLRDELESAPPNTVARRSYRILRADGAVRTVERQAMLVTGADGRPARIVGVVHDVTEARELAAQTMVADKLATLGEMAGAIAHELAQPLQAVMATAATARVRLTKDSDTATLERVCDRLAWIERQTSRAGKTIQHLLAFSRGESSEGFSRLGDALEGAMELAGHGLRRDRVEVALALPPDLPPVRGGQIAIEQVLVNLLNNARDAMAERPSRRIVIAARQEGDSVVLDMTDTGGGVAPDKLERIFEPFYTTKPVGRGTGIGLSVARRTMQALGGEITVANTEDGACFSLRFRNAAAGM